MQSYLTIFSKHAAASQLDSGVSVNYVLNRFILNSHLYPNSLIFVHPISMKCRETSHGSRTDAITRDCK